MNRLCIEIKYSLLQIHTLYLILDKSHSSFIKNKIEKLNNEQHFLELLNNIKKDIEKEEIVQKISIIVVKNNKQRIIYLFDLLNRKI